ncbi:hypothetical protein WJX73_009484 [Symbiochloris irregularis]|uniref:Uncharacterized protein n=1 Tax=Symbiochloris irregularis TaxID=706552 RepID=A0AAW1P185_9CHLO
MHWAGKSSLTLILLVFLPVRAEIVPEHEATTGRVVRTAAELQQAVKNPRVLVISLASDIYINASAWEPGSASLNRSLLIQGLVTNTRPRLDLGGVVNAIGVSSGNITLTLRDVTLSGAMSQNRFIKPPSVPGKLFQDDMNGLTHWPSIVSATGSLINFVNVTAYFYQPHALFRCHDYIHLTTAHCFPADAIYSADASSIHIKHMHVACVLLAASQACNRL